MSTPARIDELRKKFDENPRRYFAPLANEYRKAGDLDQAIALCREHLPKQPGHMSGHIVYGQALYEAGELIQARSVFESALQLDPENLIALRHLGDIAKASGDPSTARRWYERVLDADPRNDDIAAQLATLGGTPATSMPAVEASNADFAPSTPTPAFGFGVLPTPDAAMRAVDFDVVNAQIARYTPLDLDAIDSGTDRTERAEPTDVDASSVPEPVAASRPTYEPLDLDAMDAAEPATDSYATPPTEQNPDSAQQTEEDSGNVAAAENEPATSEVEVQEDDFDAAYAAAAEPHEEESSVAASDTDSVASSYVERQSDSDTATEADEEFEEGFFAPEWPADTADIIASIATPRSVTPLFNTAQAPNAVTPPFGSATPDAVLAFGRERDEPAVHEAHFEDAEFDAPSVGAESLHDVDAAPAADAEEVADDVTHLTHVSEVPAHADAVAQSEPEAEAASDAASEPEAEPAWLASVAEFEASIEPTFEDVQSSAAALGADVEIAGGAFIDETSFADVAPEPAVGAAPEALAHAHGESHEPVPSNAFADAHRSDAVQSDDWNSDADADADSEAESVNAAPAPESMPAFATETMGELLVSQGFVSRAVDVYEELVRRRPYDPVLTSRLAELRERVAAESQDGAPRNTPLHSTPLQNIAQRTTPLHSTPLQNIAERSTPLRSTPLRSTPLRNTPLRNTPLRSTPLHSTPLRSTPLHSNTVSPFGGPVDAQPLTSRELFARLAARRVPRRTPPQAISAIAPDRGEGLSSLFGGNDGGQDDSAARALADAFAPIAASDMVSGSTLDFDFGASGGSTGRSGIAVSPATPVVNSPVVPDAGGAASPTATPSANAGFSFDRFFPDPARAPKQGATPSEPAAAAPQDQAPAPAKPAEDLAQFSQWLKGLGGS